MDVSGNVPSALSMSHSLSLECPRPGWTLGLEQPGTVSGVPAMAGVGWDGLKVSPKPFWS